jgi:hypothetical protein
MDVTHQAQRPQTIVNNQIPGNGFSNSTIPPVDKKSRFKKFNNGKNTNLLFSSMIITIGLLVVLIILALVFYKTTDESSYVDTSTYQSVFVNVAGSSGGQAYFGHVVSMNSNYIILNDVFYLQPSTTSTTQFNLNSLTCALYNPDNQMIINRSQVAFWENLSKTSQVVTDINKWHTDKLQCSTASTTATTPTTTTTK